MGDIAFYEKNLIVEIITGHAISDASFEANTNVTTFTLYVAYNHEVSVNLFFGTKVRGDKY